MKTKLSVLVVDDDSIFQFLSKKILETTALTNEIYTCSNGSEALQLLKSGSIELEKFPDIIFLDINMPIMNGWEFLHEFEHIKTNICKIVPVFIVSSSQDHDDIEHARKFSTVKDYLIKPIMPKQFVEILSECGNLQVSHTTNSH